MNEENKVEEIEEVESGDVIIEQAPSEQDADESGEQEPIEGEIATDDEMVGIPAPDSIIHAEGG